MSYLAVWKLTVYFFLFSSDLGLALFLLNKAGEEKKGLDNPHVLWN